jgi:23S rRNA pseudouridine2605 synthase
VRRLWEAVGVQVSRLIRVRYGDILLPKGLPRGGYTELDLAQPTTCANWLSCRKPPLAVKKMSRMKAKEIRRAVKRHTW